MWAKTIIVIQEGSLENVGKSLVIGHFVPASYTISIPNAKGPLLSKTTRVPTLPVILQTSEVIEGWLTSGLYKLSKCTTN